MRTALIALLLFPLLTFAGVTEHAPKGTFSDSFLIVPEDVRAALSGGDWPRSSAFPGSRSAPG
jgi:hypothetical protein